MTINIIPLLLSLCLIIFCIMWIWKNSQAIVDRFNHQNPKMENFLRVLGAILIIFLVPTILLSISYNYPKSIWPQLVLSNAFWFVIFLAEFLAIITAIHSLKKFNYKAVKTELIVLISILCLSAIIRPFFSVDETLNNLAKEREKMAREKAFNEALVKARAKLGVKTASVSPVKKRASPQQVSISIPAPTKTGIFYDRSEDNLKPITVTVWDTVPYTVHPPIVNGVKMDPFECAIPAKKLRDFEIKFLGPVFVKYYAGGFSNSCRADKFGVKGKDGNYAFSKIHFFDGKYLADRIFHIWADPEETTMTVTILIIKKRTETQFVANNN